MAKKATLWPMERTTAAKHQILRKYLDAWFAILGGGRYARDHLILIDAFAGPSRYSTGEIGSPLLMINAYLEHTAEIKAKPHFYFIEENAARVAHLRGEITDASLPATLAVVIIEGTFDVEFPALVDRLKTQFNGLPPTFAFIDPFGASDLDIALSTPLLDVRGCEALIYFPVSFIARFGVRPEFVPTMNSIFSGSAWRTAFADGIDFPTRERMLLDLFMDALRQRVPYVRAFEITPTQEKGGNTYYLVFGTANAEQGLRKMKSAMWAVDPIGGVSFRDSTLADHPVLFDKKPDFAELERLLHERFGSDWFTIGEAEWFTLIETAFRDDAHLKRDTLKPAEKRGALEVERPSGQKAGSFTPGTRIRFV